MSTLRPILAVLFLGVLWFPCMGCKEGDPIQGGISPATPSFVPDPDASSVDSNRVKLQQYSATGGRIVLDVVITEVDEEITGLAVKLSYPATFSKFVSCSDGDLFPSGTCYYQEVEEGSGEVFIGRSVLGIDQATSVAGSQVAVRLEFLVFGTGSGEIKFEGQNLGGGDASAVLDIDGDPVLMQWFSGMLAGR